MDVQIHLNNKADPHILVTGRRTALDKLEQQLRFWSFQLKGAPRVEIADEIMAVDLYKRPRRLGNDRSDAAFRQRLHTVTADELSDSQIFDLCTGPSAKRESRMEIVSRLAIKTFGCKLVGGFVRDWIVRGKNFHWVSWQKK